jgi:Carbohydrate-binding module 48 (Isoamylase N-terminal domain)
VTDHEHDPLVHRAIDELRRLPPLDQAAVRRIAGAAAAARLAPPADLGADVRRPRSRWWLTIGVAAAAAVVGFVVRGVIATDRVTPSAATRAATPVRTVATTAADVVPVQRQFVLENMTARRVSVVGDFNNWNPNATPMTRSPDGGLWSAIVPIVPGRHVYGFMVNDSVFTLDPRSPKARDPDLGTDASVLMVGRP